MYIPNEIGYSERNEKRTSIDIQERILDRYNIRIKKMFSKIDP